MASSIEPTYVELTAKTNFSFLEGASHPEEMVLQAKKLELTALGIADREGLFGIVRAHTAAKEVNLPLIVGATFRFEQNDVSFLAMSRRGYGNLCRLASEETLMLSQLSERNTDLLAILHSPYSFFLLTNLKDIFCERLSLSLHRTLEASDLSRTLSVLEHSKHYGVPIVAINDAHYHAETRQPLQDLLTSIRHITPLHAAGYRLFSNGERRLKSPAEMNVLFRDLPAALSKTIELANRCHFSLDELRYQYPREFLPAGKTSDGYLGELAWKGATQHYPQGIPEAVAHQISHELSLIQKLSFSDYFLTIHDIVEFAKRRKILCQGRGSAANSTVCYVLGITAIDPVRMNLLFERFISAERGEPPDIDVDFEHERREEVIQYIYERYGRDRAAIVAEVITYRTKSARRDVKKALPPDISEEKLQTYIDEIKGFPRHLSTHVGGFVLTQEPLIECVPIQKASMPGRTIIQWDKNDLDAIGMLKVDILGLGMLTCLRKCFELLPEKNLSLSTIPAEDPKVYDRICASDTVGVFQIESRAQMGMLPRLRPRTFHDLVIEIAIVRPGPILGKMVHPYLRRRRGQEAVHYPHPALKEILGKTFGIPLFQEQVMKIAMAVAGFNPGEADRLRKAMGIWRTSRSASMSSMAEKLIAGMRKNGVPKKDAQIIFDQIKSFGEFGFPESHSASFALIAYASAYLKCYYPAAFACALLNSQPMGFYAPHSIIDDVKRHGIHVYPVDLTHSDWDSTLEGEGLRLGLRLVRGLGEKVGRDLVKTRSHLSFASVEDVIARSSLHRLQASYLAAADAFSSFGLSARDALWRLLATPFSKDDLQSGHGFHHSESVCFETPTPEEKVAADYHVLGLSVFAHPLELLRNDLRSIGVYSIEELKNTQSGKNVKVSGLLIVRQRPPTAKGMVFLTLEDETGMLNVAVPPPIYSSYGSLIASESVLVIEGKLQRDREAISLLAYRAISLQNLAHTVPPISGRNFH